MYDFLTLIYHTPILVAAKNPPRKFNFTLLITNKAPYDINVFKLNGNSTKSIGYIKHSTTSKIGNVANTDRYVFESKEGTRLVASTSDTKEYDKVFVGTKFGARSGAGLSILVSKSKCFVPYLEC